VTGLTSVTSYYFALRTADNSHNWSPISDVVQAATRGTRETPDELLSSFSWYHSDPARDLEGIASCLHTDFFFHFSTPDVEEIREQDPGFPGFWTNEETVSAVENMFLDADFISVEVVLTDSLGCETCYPDGPLCVVHEAIIDMALDVPGEPEGSTYLVQGFADVVVTGDPADPGQWVIYSIVDRTNETAGRRSSAPYFENTSWGRVLALYE
jgi:hypothetical protein